MKNELIKGSDSWRILDRFLLLLVLIVCLQLTSSQSSCPSDCLCYESRTVVCSGQGIQVFPRNVSNLIQNLDLSNNLLDWLPDEVNRLSDLQYLNLAKNKLTSLPGDLGQLTQLQKLDLSENNIVDIEDIASVNQLTNLKALYLSSNKITSLDGLTNNALLAVDASRCLISGITNTSLAGLPELVTLSLGGNPLKSVQRLTSEKLRWLDLSDCFLNYLSPDTFEGAPGLEQLRLANNPRLVYSSRHATLRHANLKRLDVSRCNLDRPGLHGMTALTHVVLSHNVIRMLPDRIFAKNRMLTQLHLNANGLKSVNRSTFAGLIKLEALDLSSNNIGFLHPSTFRENANLKLLNLSFNDLEQFPNLISSIMTLDLTANLIDTISKDSLTSMPRIRTLNLSDNGLEGVCEEFDSETLRALILRRNRLVDIANDSFSQLPQLQKLDLSGNRLTEGVNLEVFRSNKNLRFVVISDNPWRCDCDQLYQTYLYLTELPEKTSSKSLICQSPSNVSGYTWETACFNEWANEPNPRKDRTWGVIMISLVIIVLLYGIAVSIRHTISVKRAGRRERLRLEQEEARERLRLLRRRNHDLEAAARTASEPRVHPLELTNPPPYEEAVQMPRLAQSLDALDSISTDPISGQVLGSMESLRSRKRRQRRSRNRARSEENLSRREDKAQSRRVRSVPRRNYSTSVLSETARAEVTGPSGQNRAPRAISTASNRRDTESEEPSSDSRRRPRPQTPNAKRKRRRQPLNDGHSSDDEDSDIQKCVTGREIDAAKPIFIRELPREPRSGYRPPNIQEHVV